MTDSLTETDESAAAVQKTPHRISKADIEDAISSVHYVRGDRIIEYSNYRSPPNMSKDVEEREAKNAACLTICLIVMKNGFMVIGKSASADPENFDELLGQKLAYENAFRQIWPLMGFCLKDTMYRIKRDFEIRGL